MSVAVRAILASKNTARLSSNMKEEEHKSSKIENLASELDKNGDIGKDLVKEISKKAVVDHCKDASEAKVENDEKEEESLVPCKQQALQSVGSSSVGESKGPEVKILSLSVLSPGRTDVVLPIPFPQTTSKATLFTLKEGSKYRTNFHFTVSKSIVTGLAYTYMVWKAGIKVHQTKKMMGTFSPRQEPYIFELEEGTTPTGFFCRGPFLVRSKFVDEDGNCYLDTTYYFDIRKDWGSRDRC